MNLKQRGEIGSMIRYELMKGTHTFTLCEKCDRGARGVYCWSCLLEILVLGKEK